MKSVMAIVVAAAVGAAMLGFGQPGTKPMPSGPKPMGPLVMEPKGLNTLAFLRGTWSGKVGEDWVEETWSGANGDSVIGMFRWQVAGKQTTMWELLSIKDEGGKPVLRLRHFDAKFEPWKNEAGAVEGMSAKEMTEKRVLFVAEAGALKSVEYKSPRADVLEVTVTFREEGRAAIEMDLRRQ
jgi:hypothetical protein